MAESKLVQDLRQVPNILASLGLAIAEAQKQFDENYLKSLYSLAVMAKAFLGAENTGISVDFLKHLVESAAPARYQFTETTLAVKLDLAESRDWSAQAGLGFGFAGVVASAAYAYGYSADYRAGAEIRTTIHAVLPQDNKHAFDVLLNRAQELADKPLTLPARSELDQRVVDAMMKVAEFVKAEPKKITSGEGQ